MPLLFPRSGLLPEGEVGESSVCHLAVGSIIRSAAALSKHLARPCAQCRRLLRRLLCPDRPAAGKRHNGSTLGALPSYRGLLAIALLSLARRRGARYSAGSADVVDAPDAATALVWAPGTFSIGFIGLTSGQCPGLVPIFLQCPHGMLYSTRHTLAEPGRAKRWREAPDSRPYRRRVIVAFPSRRTVGAKNTPRDRRHLAQGSAKCLLRAAALRTSALTAAVKRGLLNGSNRSYSFLTTA